MIRPGLLILAILLTLSGCATKAKETAAAPDVVTVAVERATVQDLSHDLAMTAEFIPYQEVDLMSKVAGYVKKINVDIGDRVREGQLLATLEIPEMADELRKAQAEVDRAQAQAVQAQDDVRRAEANFQIAKLSYDRLSGVIKSRPGLVAQQEVDDAQAKNNTADAQVSAAKSNVVAAQHAVAVAKAEVARLQTLYEYTKVTAPFDGVVTKRYANTGSMIQAGISSQTQAMPLVRLSQNNLLRLILPVPESAVPTVHIGQGVDVHVNSLHRTFPGKVVRFSDKLALDTRTMDTEVDVPNPSLVLIPGMYAEVDLTLQRADHALTVPVTAVDADSGKVMIVTAGNRLESRDVKVGLETANRVQILSGLEQGDMVVVGSRAGLQAGSTAKPKITDIAASNAQ